jgi:hypothetical protein
LCKQHRSPLALISSMFHIPVMNVVGGHRGQLRGINAKADRYRSALSVSFEFERWPILA